MTDDHRKLQLRVQLDTASPLAPHLRLGSTPEMFRIVYFLKALLLKTLGKMFRNLKFSVYFHWLHFFYLLFGSQL